MFSAYCRSNGASNSISCSTGPVGTRQKTFSNSRVNEGPVAFEGNVTTTVPGPTAMSIKTVLTFSGCHTSPTAAATCLPVYLSTTVFFPPRCLIYLDQNNNVHCTFRVRKQPRCSRTQPGARLGQTSLNSQVRETSGSDVVRPRRVALFTGVAFCVFSAPQPLGTPWMTPAYHRL